MKRKSPHRGLELRLEVLRHRIRTLTEKMSRTEGIQKIENLAGIGRAGAAVWRAGAAPG